MSTTSAVFTDSMIAAIEQFTNKTEQTLARTLTVECDIVSVEDANTGVYTATHLGSSFPVYALDNTTTYIPGDSVYVLIPNGNYEKQKFIVGQPTNRQLQSAKLKTEITGDDIFRFQEDNYQLKLSTYKSGDSRTEISGLKNIFAFYRDEHYTTYSLSCKFKTKDIKSLVQDNRGMYGIYLTIPFKNGDKKEIFLGYDPDEKTNITNNSQYNLSIWVIHRKTFTIDNINEVDEANIKLEYKVNGFEADSNKEDIKNIFIKQIQLNPVKEFSNSQLTGYYLNIKSTRGTYLDSACLYTKLIADLRADGMPQDISKAMIYWFQQAPEINGEYQSISGPGWSLKSSGEGLTSYELKYADAAGSPHFYKCVIVYAQKTISAIIPVEFETDAYIHAGTQSFSKANETITIKNDNKYAEGSTFRWCMYDSENNWVEFTDGVEVRNQYITIPTVDIPDKAKLFCFISFDGIVKSIIEYTMSLSQLTEDFAVTIENANITYSYNDNGTVGINASSIAPLDFIVTKKNGSEISKDEYNNLNIVWYLPKVSMINFIGINSADTIIEDDIEYIIYKQTKKEPIKYTLGTFNEAEKDNCIIKIEVTINDSVIYDKTRIISTQRRTEERQSYTINYKLDTEEITYLPSTTGKAQTITVVKGITFNVDPASSSNRIDFIFKEIQ